MAASDLVETLRECGEQQEALQLGIETLPIVRRMYGDEHEDTLRAISRLASVHAGMEDYAAALPLETAVLAVRRRVSGNDNKRPRLEHRRRGHADRDGQPLSDASQHGRLCRRPAVDAGGSGEQATDAGQR